MRVDVTRSSLRPTDLLELLLPIGSTVRHIGEQKQHPGAIQVWYERPVPASGEMVVRLYCFGTGHTIDVSNLRAAYFQTVIMRSGLVWHFYISYPEVLE